MTTKTKQKAESATDLAQAPLWDVIVWNDPINLMTFVIFVFQRIFGYPTPLARKLMLEVHHQGRATVATEPREKAEHHVHQLHGYGLQATLCKHD
jgi:ATP-dependent Clp protease adaptor protein ClpS